MLNIEIKKSNLPILKEKKFTTSKKIAIDINVEAILQINFSQKNIVSLIDNLIIDLILSKTEKENDTYNSFSLILEKLNKEIKKLSKDYNLSGLNIFIGIVHGDILHFSILGEYSIYLIKSNKILNIADGMQGKNLEFSYISSGNIGAYDNIYVSNVELLDHITKDDIFEISKIRSNENKINIIERIFAEEDVIEEQYEIIFISSYEKTETEVKEVVFLDIVKDKYKLFIDKFKEIIIENEQIKRIFEKIKSKIDFQNKNIYASFFILGLLFSSLLLYIIISSILNTNINSAVPEEYKNKLIEANSIIKNVNKDLGNKEIFYTNIKKAEDLIFQVRDKQVFLNDVKKLLDEISILKKQVNGIESVTLKPENAQILFQDKTFAINSIFELNKKLYFIGKNGIIGPYIKGGQATIYPYPDGEEAISSDVSSEGQIYILTKTYKILQFYKQEYKFLTIEGQNTWENSKLIKTYNSNIYLLNATGNQILRHKPGISGFSSKFSIIDSADAKNINMIDFAIDGGFYLFKQDLSIDKIFTVPLYSKRSIVINGLPEDYTIEGTDSPRIFTGQNLNYIYILLNNKIWILEGDSKNYKDVKNFKYIGQIEPQELKTNAIFIPKDGIIYIGNNNGVYNINFEISDGKIIIR